LSPIFPWRYPLGSTIWQPRRSIIIDYYPLVNNAGVGAGMCSCGMLKEERLYILNEKKHDYQRLGNDGEIEERR